MKWGKALLYLPLNVGILLDVTVNVALLGRPGETISARCHRKRFKPGWKQARVVVNGIFFFQKDHCEWAFERERQHLNMPHEYRNPVTRKETLRQV